MTNDVLLLEKLPVSHFWLVFTDLSSHILQNSMRCMFQFTGVKKVQGTRMSYELYCAHTHTQTRSEGDNRTTSMPKPNYTLVLLTLGCLNGEQA